jgi:hypothetical protein
MPSTYTTNNGIEKIGTGEQSGTWGDTTNLNFDILDQALDGLVTITATDTGSSGSPNTLPITDGSLSDGRNRLIIITDGGDLGGSVYYQLTPADAEKIVFLRNSLSGSQDLILFQGTYNAARDLIVPAGKDVIIKFSGGGTSNAVVAPVFADLSLDAATIASADINGGTIDGVTIGVTSVATVINVDNLKLDGNTLSSTDTNGNVVLAPNGDGDVQLDADTVRVGDSNNDVTITTNGTGDLTLNTNGGTDSGSIEIQDGVNTNIIVTANGTGKLELANGDITTSAASGSDAAGQDLTIQAGASTGNAAGGDMIFQTTPAGAGSGSVLNSYTTVLTLTDDSKMQIGTSTAVNSILDEDDMNSDSETALATQQSIKAYVDSQVGTVDTLAEILANGNTTGGTDIAVSTGDDITFADDSKAIFGAGSDLEIYHSGTHSFIEDKGTGNLYIDGSSSVVIRGDTASTISAVFNDNGAVNLRYDGDIKLATTSTGVDITGTLTSDSLTVDGVATLNRTNPILIFNETDTTDLNAGLNLNGSSFAVAKYADAGNKVNDILSIDISTGDISFYEDTGTTPKFFWDASAERLGIGNSSPTTTLDVTGTITSDGLTVSPSGTQQVLATLRANSGSGGGLVVQTDASDDGLIRGYDGSGNIQLQFDTDGGDNYIAQGNVGIGTTSPATSVSGSAQGLAIQHSNVAYMSLDNTGSSGRRYTMYSNTGGNLVTYDEDAASTRMVIDSSGNLLVGKTSLGIGITGSEIRAGGQLLVTADGDNPADFNRKTSDGVIALFRKDGSTVGSIGVVDSQSTGEKALYIGTNSSTTLDVGLIFDCGPNEIHPADANGVARDAAINLGGDNERFKDLYLSGGVYLGGTGAANKLDDYEEGTWTPTITSSGTNPTVTYSAQAGKYTKVGNMVTIFCRLDINTYSGGTGVAKLSGLPFTISNDQANNGNVYCLTDLLSFDRRTVSMQAIIGSATMQLVENGGTTSSHAGMAITDLNASSVVRFQYSYFV